MTPKAPRATKTPKKGKGKDAAAPAEAKPLTQDEIQAKVNDWKPSIERRRKHAVSRVAKLVANLSSEEKEILMASFKNDGDNEPTTGED
jgi:hypothetical protein